MAARRKSSVATQEAKTNEAVKETRKTTRKSPVKRPVDPDVSVILEYQGLQTPMKDVLERAMEAYKASHADAEIKTIQIYVKPEEKAAYYVVNGESSADFKVAV